MIFTSSFSLRSVKKKKKKKKSLKTLEVGSPEWEGLYRSPFLAFYSVTASKAPARWEAHQLDELLSRSQVCAEKRKAPQSVRN